MSRLNKSALHIGENILVVRWRAPGACPQHPKRQNVRKRGCGGWLNPRLCQRSNGWPKEAIVFNRIRLRFDEITASIRIVTI